MESSMTWITTLRKKLERRSILRQRNQVLRTLEGIPHDHPTHPFHRLRLLRLETRLTLNEKRYER